jgi:uncharacterized protein HemX
MKRSGKLLLVAALILLAGFKGFSQTNTLKVDSLRLKEKQLETAANANEQSAKGNAYGQANGKNATKAVKQVKAGRPDMSKAKGARPPMIVRPSGSGIPKGIGKPGGVGRKGGR